MQAPQECPAEVEQLIDLCLAMEPADRPSAKQAFDIISSCSPSQAATGYSTDPPMLQRSQPTYPVLSPQQPHAVDHMALRPDHLAPQRSQPASPMLSLQQQQQQPPAVVHTILQQSPAVDHTAVVPDQPHMRSRSQTTPFQQAPARGALDLDHDRSTADTRPDESWQTAAGQEQSQAGKLNSQRQTQGTLLLPMDQQQPVLEGGLDVSGLHLHQAPAAPQSASEHLQATETGLRHSRDGTTQVQSQSIDPARHDGRDISAVHHLQGLQHEQEPDTNHPLHPFQAASNRQSQGKAEGVALSDSKNSPSGSMNSNILPLGVQGHLYPSPFAMASDDGSGELWSWPNAPAAAHT